MKSLNEFAIDGIVEELSALRMTPAGLPVIEGVLRHRSMQDEAGLPRAVQAFVPFVAVGELARCFSGSPLGVALEATGFIAVRSAKSRRLVLHMRKIRFVEGNENGIQTQAS